jgi:hypothetical protein
MFARLERPLFIVLAVVAGLMLAFLGLLVGGHFVEDESDLAVRKGPPPAGPAATTRTTTPKRTRSTTAARPKTTTAASTTVAATSPARTSAVSTLVVSASRGDCWLEVRRGSATGASLYAGTLLQGQSVRFRSVKFWIRFGAAANVDVTIDGDRVGVPTGTADVVLARDARGVRLAAG